MLSLSLRSLLAHKIRFVMTTFAVVMGVGFVVGAFVVTDTLRASVDALFADVNSGVDIQVRAVSGLESGGQGGGPSSRGRVPAELLPDVAAVDGVLVADGSIGGYAQLFDKNGDPMTTAGAPFLGVGWGDADVLYPVRLDEGRKPTAPGEVAIDRGTAADYGFRPGDRTTALFVDGQTEVEIVGVFTFGEANSLLGARLTALSPDWAWEKLGTPGQYDSIDVKAGPGVDVADLAARIQAVLPAGYEAVPGQQVVDEAADQVGTFLGVFQTVLLVFAGIALFVSAYYINNTFSIVLGQRVRELSLLRAVGASGRQVTGSVLIEALVVGVLASVVGIAFGMVIAVFLQGILAAGGFELPESGLVLAPRTVLAAVVVGIPVTLVAAVLPAWRAAHIPPVQGMAEGALPGGLRPSVRFTIGAVLSLVGAVLLVLGLFVIEETALLFLALGLGAVSLFIGISQLSPLFATPVAGAIGWPLARVTRTSGRLARANAMRNPERTAKTAAALMIGLALVTMVFIVGASLKESFAKAVEGAVTADYVVSSPSFNGFSPELAQQLLDLDEIDAASGIRFDRFVFEGTEQDLLAVDATSGPAVVNVEPLAGRVEDLGPGKIAVFEDVADERGLSVGDTVDVEFASGGPQAVEVVAIYGDATFAGNYFIDLDWFSELYPADNLDFFVFARVADGYDPAAVRPAVEAVLEAYPQLELQSRAEYNQSQQDQVDQILLAVNGLLGLTLVIALLGIANTLALSVVERTREIGLLRAVGMSRRQTRGMVEIESVIVAVFGALLGVAVGLVFGLGATAAMPESVITVVAVPVPSLVTVVIVAGMAGVLAGLLPARRAARLNVLDAITIE